MLCIICFHCNTSSGRSEVVAILMLKICVDSLWMLEFFLFYWLIFTIVLIIQAICPGTETEGAKLATGGLVIVDNLYRIAIYIDQIQLFSCTLTTRWCISTKSLKLIILLIILIINIFLQ